MNDLYDARYCRNRVCDELDSGSCGESSSGFVILSTLRGKLAVTLKHAIFHMWARVRVCVVLLSVLGDMSY